MKKYPFTAICFSLLLVFITGCQTDDSEPSGEATDRYLTDEATDQKRSNSVNGVTIQTEKAEYPSSVKLVTVEIRNDSNEEFLTGIHVFLEKKVKDTWYNVPRKEEALTEEGIIHRPNIESSLTLNVNDLKYKLTPGEYRATINGLAAPFKVVE